MRFFRPLRALPALSLLAPNFLPSLVTAIDLDPSKPDQVRDAAKHIASELVSQYANINFEGKGQTQILSGIPGLLTYPPYYWWEAGAMFGTLIDYWYYSNDSTYNDLIRDGMVHQFGENLNLMPANQSKDEGNDDQVFWAFTMMSAAEYNFPKPPADKPDWLAMTQSVFNQLVSRFEKEVADEVCGGGLRWQIYPWLNGFNYKNTASNGGMFHLGARLAMYTKNDTYAKWAERAFDWMKGTALLSDDGEVADGLLVEKDCKEADHTPWTYNYGIMIGGAAYMYAYTNGSKVWGDRLSVYVNKTTRFFPEDKGSVMVEICEAKKLCDIDQVSFKAYLARWYAIAVQLAPFTRDQIIPRLQHSAQAAAKTCTGASPHGAGNYFCGTKWWNDGVFDGDGGVGQQMSALAIVSVNLVELAAPPYTKESGGNSEGDPGLGSGGDENLPIFLEPATIANKVGASILTILAVLCTVGTGYWMMN